VDIDVGVELISFQIHNWDFKTAVHQRNFFVLNFYNFYSTKKSIYMEMIIRSPARILVS